MPPRALKVAEYETASPAQTRRLGESLGRRLHAPLVLALNGDLGSGKTVLVRGLAKGLGVKNAAEIRSPTFALIQEHPGAVPLCHADLYRISQDEARELGLQEYWKRGSPYVCAIEWAERAEALLPQGSVRDEAKTLEIRFEAPSARIRRLIFYGDATWKKALQNIKF